MWSAVDRLGLSFKKRMRDVGVVMVWRQGQSYSIDFDRQGLAGEGIDHGQRLQPATVSTATLSAYGDAHF
jgi:hypothetical protein